MRNGNVWELDMYKELRRYEDASDSVLYPDSRYYRKNTERKFKLDEDDEIVVPDSDKSAGLYS